MFDLDQFLADCVAARADSSPHGAIGEVLRGACTRPGQVLDVLPPERAGITTLHRSDDLTVLHVVWGPKMTLRPHDHRMWAAIGICSGGEDNTFFRREGTTIAATGVRELRPRDVILLGDDTIHSVVNPTSSLAGAIHVYAGDFFAVPRSEWNPDTLEEQPYDVQATLAHFERQNALLDAGVC